VDGPHLKNLLLTGPPGCGKTITVRRLVERLADLCLAGLDTQGPREGGTRGPRRRGAKESALPP
jgi:nucleoside-triphosphatase THEP1